MIHRRPGVGVLAAWLTVALPVPSLGAQDDGPSNAPLPPVSARDSLEARLSLVNGRVEQAPRDLEARMTRIRVLYALGVAEDDHLDALAAERERVRVLGGTPTHTLLLDGYAAAAEVVRGKHAFWPHAKMAHVNRGLDALDALVEEHPHHLELRYLRLVSTHFLPFFFRRGGTARSDLAAVVAILERERERHPPDLEVPALAFALEEGVLDATQRARFQDRLAEARTRMETRGW